MDTQHTNTYSFIRKVIFHDQANKTETAKKKKKKKRKEKEKNPTSFH